MIDTVVFDPSRWPYVDRFPIRSLIPTYLCRTLSLIFDTFLRTYPAAFARAMCTRSPADTYRLHMLPVGLGYPRKFNLIKNLAFSWRLISIWSYNHLWYLHLARASDILWETRKSISFCKLLASGLPQKSEKSEKTQEILQNVLEN